MFWKSFRAQSPSGETTGVLVPIAIEGSQSSVSQSEFRNRRSSFVTTIMRLRAKEKRSMALPARLSAAGFSRSAEQKTSQGMRPSMSCLRAPEGPQTAITRQPCSFSKAGMRPAKASFRLSAA